VRPGGPCQVEPVGLGSRKEEFGLQSVLPRHTLLGRLGLANLGQLAPHNRLWLDFVHGLARNGGSALILYAAEATKPPFCSVFELCRAAVYGNGLEAVFAQKRVLENLYRLVILAFSCLVEVC